VDSKRCRASIVTSQRFPHFTDGGIVVTALDQEERILMSTAKSSSLRPEDFLNIDSQLSEEEIAIRNTVRRFVQQKVEPNIADWFEEGRSPTGLMKELGAIGVLGMHASP
jgi:hypothetical protein